MRGTNDDLEYAVRMVKPLPSEGRDNVLPAGCPLLH